MSLSEESSSDVEWENYEATLDDTIRSDVLQLSIVYNYDGGDTLQLYDGRRLYPILDPGDLYLSKHVILTNVVRTIDRRIVKVSGYVLFDEVVKMKGQPSKTNKLTLVYRDKGSGEMHSIVLTDRFSLRDWYIHHGTLVPYPGSRPEATLSE